MQTVISIKTNLYFTNHRNYLYDCKLNLSVQLAINTVERIINNNSKLDARQSNTIRENYFRIG